MLSNRTAGTQDSVRGGMYALSWRVAAGNLGKPGVWTAGFSERIVRGRVALIMGGASQWFTSGTGLTTIGLAMD